MRDYIHILPNELSIDGMMDPEQRNRGIYDIVVYNSKLNVKGKFAQVNFAELDIPIGDIQFDKARLVVGIDDLRGIEKQVDLSWNESKYAFNPGVASNDIVSSGINTLVNFNSNDSSTYMFSFSLDLKGSQLLYFTPVGKVTDIKVSSNWTNPSFNGAFLPDLS